MVRCACDSLRQHVACGHRDNDLSVAMVQTTSANEHWYPVIDAWPSRFFEHQSNPLYLSGTSLHHKNDRHPHQVANQSTNQSTNPPQNPSTPTSASTSTSEAATMVDPSILQLNNHAVALMLAGHESTAHATLQTAFSQLKAEVGSPQPCEHAAPEVRSSPRSVPAKNCSHVAIETTEEPKPQMAPSSMMEVDASQTSNPIYCTAQELDGMKDLEFVLNSQPLLFDESCQQDLPFDVCVSAILFNLALLFHHAALRTRRSSRQRSTSNHPRVHSSRTTSTTATARNNANSNNQGKSAMEMQRVTTSMAYSLYATSRNFARSSFCTSSVLPAATVLIASSNNLACLQCDLGQSDQADETFAETVRSLRCSNSGVLSQALGNELGNIFLNRMTWKNVIVASAA